MWTLKRGKRDLRYLSVLAGLLGWVGLLVVGGGCASSHSTGAKSRAALTIKGHPIADIILTTRQVFEDHDFQFMSAANDQMVFDRPGTRMEQVSYGSFGSEGLVIRVKVDLQELAEDQMYLRCDVFSVRDPGAAVLEDETRLVLARVKPYQELLEEVQARLDSAGR